MDRTGEWTSTKYPYVVHAELNCILNSIMSAKGSTMYCTLFPCNECAKAIVQVGIKEVIFADDKYHDSVESTASRRILELAGVRYRRYKGRDVEISVK